MDSFGILRLLGSLLGEINKTKSGESSTAKAENTPAFSEKKDENSPAPQKKAPLYDKLLKTSASHEEFVSRVYSGNKKTP